MKRIDLFIFVIVVLGLAVTAGCQGTSKGVEVENPTPEISQPTPYRNMIAGVEIAYPADFGYTEPDPLRVEFRPLRAEAVSAAVTVVFFKRTVQGEDLQHIVATLDPGVPFAPSTLGAFEKCVDSSVGGGGTAERWKRTYCDLDEYIMDVEYRFPPIGEDVTGLFAFQTISSLPASGSLVSPDAQKEETGMAESTKGWEKPDCAATPDSPGCMKQPVVNEDGTCGAGEQTDNDCDGLTNKQEKKLGSDPNNPDSDGDGIPDGDEPPGCITTSKPWEVCAETGD